MKRKILILFALMMILLLAAAAPVFSADAAKGKEIYTKKCASCHAASGEGKESLAKMLKVEMKHLGAKEVLAKSDADLKKTVSEGSGKMKPVKDIDASGLDDVVAYLRTLAKK